MKKLHIKSVIFLLCCFTLSGLAQEKTAIRDKSLFWSAEMGLDTGISLEKLLGRDFTLKGFAGYSTMLIGYIEKSPLYQYTEPTKPCPNDLYVVNSTLLFPLTAQLQLKWYFTERVYSKEAPSYQKLQGAYVSASIEYANVTASLFGGKDIAEGSAPRDLILFNLGCGYTGNIRGSKHWYFKSHLGLVVALAKLGYDKSKDGQMDFYPVDIDLGFGYRF